ncbi:hypothetical protein AA12717_1407 [Gluconacetobacter sacchari DSM 12717]|uniref:Phage tail assembly protein n=2 Tax=Gluconacetobacter sacchari TaxID=92759 RepID=A0A7W4IBF2_9PROT|nr:phage tail assembly protein [Gluconacetobacter sacchari]MBB2159728.1 phage tail assembly protein [Gluconacetobacter sacchari]GBQ23147.1 hypothetical protein AA12717_1407 [Gluconacetobacter sacchari DSM 12717]
MTLEFEPLSDEAALAAFTQSTQSYSSPERDTMLVMVEPIEWKKQQFDCLRLREPVVAQVLFSTRAMGKRPTEVTVRDAQLDLVERVSGWPSGAVGMLQVSVQDRCIMYLTDFEEEARRPVDAEPERTPEMRLLLTVAVEATGKSHSEMVLREPVGTERRRYDVARERATPEALLQAEVNLVADVSGWPLAAVLKMPISDFARAADYLTGFFIRGPRTGPISRPS